MSMSMCDVLSDGLCWCLYDRWIDGRSKVYNRSGANLKGDAGLLDGGLVSPHSKRCCQFCFDAQGRYPLISIYEARSGRLVDKGLIVLSWTRTCVVDGEEVKKICSARPQAHESSSSGLGMATGRQVKLIPQ